MSHGPSISIFFYVVSCCISCVDGEGFAEKSGTESAVLTHVSVFASAGLVSISRSVLMF